MLLRARYYCTQRYYVTFGQLRYVCTACRPAPLGSNLQTKRFHQRTSSGLFSLDLPLSVWRSAEWPAPPLKFSCWVRRLLINCHKLTCLLRLETSPNLCCYLSNFPALFLRREGSVLLRHGATLKRDRVEHLANSRNVKTIVGRCLRTHINNIRHDLDQKEHSYQKYKNLKYIHA